MRCSLRVRRVLYQGSGCLLLDFWMAPMLTEQQQHRRSALRVGMRALYLEAMPVRAVVVCAL